MKPTPKVFVSRLTPLRNDFNLIATTPSRGLSRSNSTSSVQRFFVTFWLFIKGALIQFATIIPAMVGFHLIGRFIYHSTPAWLPGCAIGIAVAGVLWTYYCASAGYPVLWALGTLSLSTLLWFFLLIAVFRAQFLFDHHSTVAASDAAVLAVSVALVLWLRHQLTRRNKKARRIKT